MIGLGVGIDYALFILTRFREAYATPGPTFGDARESVVQAIDTAGRAVLFAGCTVVIALLGMMLLGVSFLYGVAISASIGVLLVMLASLTLLPALLTLSGDKVAAGGRRARARAKARAQQSPEQRAASSSGTAAGSTWLRWSAFVERRPRSIAAVSALVMLAIAAPATALRLGSSDASNDPSDQTTHRAYELLAEGLRTGLQRAAARGREGAGPRARSRAERRRRGSGPERRRRRRRTAPRSRRRHAGRRRRGSRAPEPRRHRRDRQRVPALLAAGLRDDPARRTAACQGAAAAGGAHRHEGLRRRRDRRLGRLRDDARAQAAAVHRRRRAALGAAAAGRLPLAADPAAGCRDEPAEHRRIARRDRRDLPVGLAENR